MSNYNSIHTGAELDEAIGRVIDGGSVKVQTDTNTTDITDLKGRMITAEGNVRHLDETILTLTDIENVTSIEHPIYLAKGGGYTTILPYIGKRNLSLTVKGGSGCTIVVRAKNKATGNNVTLYNSVLNSDEVLITNSRTDLDLIDLQIACSSSSASSFNGSYIITKENQVAHLTQIEEDVETTVDSVASVSKSVATLDNTDELSTIDIPLTLAKSATEIIIPYLGFGEASITIKGGNGAGVTVLATNKATDVGITWFSGTLSSDSVTISNPRPDLEFINLRIRCNSSSASAFDGTYSITKPNNVADKNSVQNISNELFDLDNIDSVSTYFDVNANKGSNTILTPYIGKKTASFSISNPNGAKIKLSSKNKATGTGIAWTNTSGDGWTTDTEVTGVNPRTDLEMINLTIAVASGSGANFKGRIAITKDNSILHDDFVHEWKSPFGKLCTFDFTCPTLPALPPRPTGSYPSYTNPQQPGECLAYFYDLYDNLVELYPDYITKVDLMSEAEGKSYSWLPDGVSSITKPEAMNAYPIYAYNFKPVLAPRRGDVTISRVKPVKVMILAGTHPEYLCIYDTYLMIKMICEQWASYKDLEDLRWNVELYVMPCAGADCVDRWQRKNINGVDMNRNCPTKGFTVSGEGTETYTGPYGASEYATQILGHYLETVKPDVFIDHHNTQSPSASNPGDGKNMMYFQVNSQEMLDISGDVISLSTRKWKQRYTNIFPNVNVTPYVMFGYTRSDLYASSRARWASELGAKLSATAESNAHIIYMNGVIDWTNRPAAYGSEVVTCAVEWMINFITRCASEVPITYDDDFKYEI